MSYSKTIALICAYNEEKYIKKVIRDTFTYSEHILVIDDCSKDNTEKIAREAGAICIKHKVNQGKGGALKTGFKYCIDNNYDTVITLDGDGQHDPAEIPLLLEGIKKYDIVIGTRDKLGTGMPIIRVVTNTICSFLVSLLSFKLIKDTQSGYRAIKTSVLKDMPLVSERYNLESEILIRAGKRGYKIGEVPIKTIYGDEKSKINPLFDTLRFVGLVFRGITWW